MEGTIFNIQKFCVNDGPGIRTTVFLKGCPLKCLWCHNPESQADKPEVMFYDEKCVSCGRCAQVCPQGCHVFPNGTHRFNRENCVHCFQCTELGCEALEKAGKRISAEEALSEVLKDKIFYETSGGGMTLSGGEPLYQFDFSLDLLKKAKEAGLHTAMETCGLAAPEKIREIAEYVDLFLFDWKETNEELHKQFTGVGNRRIIENLELLNALSKDIILRCPIIPGCNDREEHFSGIADTANRLEHILHIELEPYHALGEGKYLSLGQNARKFNAPSEEEKQRWLSRISALSVKKVQFA